MTDMIKERNLIGTIMKKYVKELTFHYENPNQLYGLSTGFDCLDNHLNGLKSGELTIIGSSSAMGKTNLAINLTYNIASDFYLKNQQNQKNDKCIIYVGLNMTEKIFAKRLLRLSLHESIDFRTHGLYCKEDLDNAVHIFQRLPIYYLPHIFEVNDIKNEIKKIKKSVGCIVIDYLQLFRSDLREKKDYHAIVLRLKSLAVHLNVPIIILSQLDKSLEYRANKKPQINDICGYTHNQNAVDNILFVYREIYYLSQQIPIKHLKESNEKFEKRSDKWEKHCKEVKNLCDIIIAKNNGFYDKEEIEMYLHPFSQKFTEKEKENETFIK